MLKILLVDDDRLFLDLLKEVFESEKFEVRTLPSASNICEEAAIFSPHVILMDFTMPGMSGLDASQALHADPRNREIPIILLSAVADVADLEKAKDWGVVMTLTKPIAFPRLISIVRDVADGKRPDPQNMR